MRSSRCPQFGTAASPSSVLSQELHGWLCRAGAGSTDTVTCVHFVAAELTGTRFMSANCGWKNNREGLSTACDVCKSIAKRGTHVGIAEMSLCVIKTVYLNLFFLMQLKHS